ncbi:MAG: sigma 54-interacting transcriptional regulator [Bilophila sp.]
MQSLAQHFESILNILSDGVFISDMDGTTLFVNTMYETLTGLRREDIVGKNVRALVQQGVFDRIINPKVVETRKPATHVQQLGNGKRLVLTGFPVFDDKDELCLVVTFARDITVLTQLQDEMTAQKKLIEQFHDRLAFMAREQTRELVPVFESREMRDVMSLVERFAVSDATVLILGETGVGKDVIARLTHELSPRKEKMFLKVDCGGISEGLTESELFGYVPGAFTGAGNKGKSGYFEMADGGTVFLDEIGELSLPMQTRLLRVLQDGEIMRVGSSKPRKVDVRIIAATNRNLAERVEEGLFRRDLYYRLNVAIVNIPALRERPDDILPLVNHFLVMFTTKYRKQMSLAPGLMELLRQYSWPGNVRELQNLMHSLIITKDQGLLTVKDLPRHMVGTEHEDLFSPDDGINYDRPLKDIMADIESGILRKALRVHGSVQKVAEVFKINRSTIFRKLHNEKSE